MNNLDIVVSAQQAIITTNFDSVKEQLSDITQAYEGLTYTEDNIPAARTDVATLRKIRKAIDDKRKALKSEINVPYVEFEKSCKELCKMIDDVIDPINEQINEYTEKKRTEKKEYIEDYFNVNNKLDFIKFEDVFENKWITNMSTSITSIKESIDSKLEGYKQDVEAIESTDSDVKDKALQVYKKNKNLVEAIAYINQYERQRAEMLKKEKERRKQEERKREEERIREEERKKIEAEKRLQEEREKIAREEREKVLRELEEQKQAEEEVETDAGFEVKEDIGFEIEDGAGFAVSGGELAGFDNEEVEVLYEVIATEEQHKHITKTLIDMGVVCHVTRTVESEGF